LRALGLVDGLTTLIPAPETPSPLELLAADRAKGLRQRAPRTKRLTTVAARPATRG